MPELEKQQAANQAAVVTLTAKRDALQKQQKETEKQVDELTNAISAVQDQKLEQRAKLQGNQQDVKALQVRVNDVQQDIAKLRDQLVRVTEQSPTGGPAQ